MINNISFSDDHFNRLSKFLNRLNQGELSQPEAKEFFHDMFGVEIHFESDNESKLRILKLIREVGLSEKEKRTDKKERIFAWEKGWNEIADSLNVLSRNIKIDDLQDGDWMGRNIRVTKAEPRRDSRGGGGQGGGGYGGGRNRR